MRRLDLSGLWMAALATVLGGCRSVAIMEGDGSTARGWQTELEDLVDRLVEVPLVTGDLDGARVEVRPIQFESMEELDSAAVLVGEELHFLLADRVPVMAEPSPGGASPFRPTHSVEGELSSEEDGVLLTVELIDLTRGVVIAPARGVLSIGGEVLVPSRSVTGEPGPTLHHVPGGVDAHVPTASPGAEFATEEPDEPTVWIGPAAARLAEWASSDVPR
ncbi:MAG: hypothetical protein ACYSWX_02870 [Planctomycetota bacterium]